jgi:uncharacterized repeat protein (TIGR01451 family)
MEQEIAIRPGRTVGRSLAVVLALIVAAVLVMALSSSTAKADPVSYSFDNGVINLGGPDGTWAKLIDKSIPDPPATLAADVAGDGALTADAEDFFFPLKKIEDLDVTEAGKGVLTFVDATIKITAEGPITGNFDTATGASDVTIPADVFITVYNAGSPASLAKCRIDGFDLVLNTTAETMSDPGAPADPPTPERPAADYAASAFDPADDGKGAMIASWEGLPSAESEGGSLAWAVCPGLDDMLGGPGGAWLDGKAGGDIVVVPQPAPTVAPKITGTPAASTESTTGAFTFSQGDTETSEVTGFQCKLDGGAFEACDDGTKSYSGLAVGGHTFEVKATNSEGEGPVSAPYSWTITEASEPCPSGTTGTPPNCVTVKKPAKLGALSVKPASKSVKPGKKATFTAKVKNVGGKTASGVKICVTAPKKLISVKKCVTVGSISAGKTKSVKFKVTVNKQAKKGKKAVLKFKATSKNAGAKTAKATVKVK